MSLDGTPRTLLVIGSGVLAGNVLDLLAWHGFAGQLIVGSRNERSLLERTNLSRIAAYNQDRYPAISTRYLDLDDVDRSAETIADIKPDVIFNTASVQTYWRISALPRELFRELSTAGLGSWLPMHLSPALRLMTALRLIPLAPIVVNAAYPDAVNPALATRGLAPTAGIGNVMNVVPAVRHACALTLKAPVDEVCVRLVAHHYVSNRLPEFGDSGGAPFHLRVYWNERDVTDAIDVAQTLRLLPTQVRRTRGSAGMYVTASSAFAVLTALMSPDPVALHVPGPSGLPGGYPVRVSDQGVRLDLPDSCPRDMAVAINERGQIFDGVRSIEPDGRVVFTDHSVEVMNRMLHHRCAEFRVEDSHELAAELSARYRAYESAVTGLVSA